MRTPSRHVLHVGCLPPAPIDPNDGDRHTLITDRLSAAALSSDQRGLYTDIHIFRVTTTANVGSYDRELDAITAAAAELSGAHGPPSVVVGLGEHVAVPAALLRTIYGCPGTDLHTAHLCRDKIEMKRAVAAAGISVPRAWEISESSAAKVLAQMAAQGDGRFILKPRRLAGSLGVQVVDTIRELASYIEHHGLEDDVEVEEFIDGDVLHLDGVVRGGRLIFFSASRYLSPPVSFERNKTPLASVRLTSDDELTRAHRFAEEAAAAVGLRDSVFHLEAFDTTAGLVFLEIAARFGGGGVCPHIGATYGVDLITEAYLACLELPSRIRPEDSEARFAASGWLLTPLPGDGQFRVLSSPAIGEATGLVWSRLPKAGDVLDSSKTFVATGTFVLAAESEQEVRTRMSQIVDQYTVALTPA